jgi:hypothetical protein
MSDMANTNLLNPTERNQKNQQYYSRMRPENRWAMRREPHAQYDYIISTRIRGFEIRWATKPPYKKGQDGLIFCSAYFNGSTSSEVKEIYQFIHDTHKEDVNQAFKDYQVEWRHSAKKDRQIRISTKGNTFDETQYQFCSDWMANHSLPLVFNTLVPFILEFVRAHQFLLGNSVLYKFVNSRSVARFQNLLEKWRDDTPLRNHWLIIR